MYDVLRECLRQRGFADPIEPALRDHVADKAKRAAERDAEEAQRAADAAALDQAEVALTERETARATGATGSRPAPALAGRRRRVSWS